MSQRGSSWPVTSSAPDRQMLCKQATFRAITGFPWYRSWGTGYSLRVACSCQLSYIETDAIKSCVMRHWTKLKP
jgi:hypothetical protein